MGEFSLFSPLNSNSKIYVAALTLYDCEICLQNIFIDFVRFSEQKAIVSEKIDNQSGFVMETQNIF